MLEPVAVEVEQVVGQAARNIFGLHMPIPMYMPGGAINPEYTKQ